MHHHRSQRTARSTQLCLERLEDRCVPSAVTANPRELTVMSRNLYVGADITPVVAAVTAPVPNPATIIAAVTQTWQNILATDFPERAELLADEIEQTAPHLVGLQEVSLLRTGAPDAFFGNATEATNVEFDYLQILLDELASRGLHYSAIAVTENFDAEFTGYIDTDLEDEDLRDIRLTDRDVILARTDVPQMKLSNIQEENFTTNLQIPLATGGFFTALRGWNSVDVKYLGQKVRFINTHLEPDFVPIQNAQAAELIAGPAATSMGVIMVGDFNSPAPTGSSYNILIDGGFTDAWAETHPGEPGNTFGNEPDLLNDEPLTFQPQRIDLILFRGDITARTMDIVGDDARTESDLWPSDHAGVVATLGVHVRPKDKPAFVQEARLHAKVEIVSFLSSLGHGKQNRLAVLDWLFAQWV